MVKVISFDLNETLVSRDYVDYFWLELIPLEYAKQNNINFEKAFSYVISKYEEIGQDDIRWYLPEYWIRCFNLRTSLDELLEKTSFRIKIYSEVPEVLKELHNRYTLIISTNTSIEFINLVIRKINKVIGYSVFYKVFSCVTNLGLPRKDKVFYEYICKELKIKPSEILHVGDDLVYDYIIPKSVGFKTLLICRNFKRMNKIKKDIKMISNLRELLKFY